MKQVSICTFLLLFFINTYGQEISEKFNLNDTTQLHLVQTKRGDRFIGRVLEIQNTSVFFLFREDQQLVFQLNELKSIDVYDPNDPNGLNDDAFTPSFMVFMPTAFNLKQGDFEYHNVELAWNTFTYGISDHFSIGGGFIVPIAFVLKFRGTTPLGERTHIGFDALNVVPLIEDADPLSIVTLNASFGEASKFLNVGVGYAFDWGFPDDAGIVFSFGGSSKISKKVGFNGALNYFSVEGDDYFFSTVGFNFYGKKNRIGLGIVIDTSQELLGIFGIPVVSFSQRF